jgi:rhodanese-related sulfurtransferase
MNPQLIALIVTGLLTLNSAAAADLPPIQATDTPEPACEPNVTPPTKGPVKFTPTLDRIEVKQAGRKTLITRNPDNSHTITGNFAKTSRPCPPFCLQPGSIAAGVDTIGELEVLDALKRMHSGAKDILVIDARLPAWTARGTIPGSLNIPWINFDATRSDPFTVSDTLEKQLGVLEQEGLWNFSQAKTLVIFCNGAWCNQSPGAIRALLKLGYPADKIKWYRGGMQDWQMLGLSVSK